MPTLSRERQSSARSDTLLMTMVLGCRSYYCPSACHAMCSRQLRASEVGEAFGGASECACERRPRPCEHFEVHERRQRFANLGLLRAHVRAGFGREDVPSSTATVSLRRGSLVRLPGLNDEALRKTALAPGKTFPHHSRGHHIGPMARARRRPRNWRRNSGEDRAPEALPFRKRGT